MSDGTDGGAILGACQHTAAALSKQRLPRWSHGTAARRPGVHLRFGSLLSLAGP